MARPLSSGKQPVSLATDGPRVSRIRRDPPPAEKKPKELRHPDDVNRSAVMIGVLAFALSIVVILLAFSAYTGRSPREYIVQM